VPEKKLHFDSIDDDNIEEYDEEMSMSRIVETNYEEDMAEQIEPEIYPTYSDVRSTNPTNFNEDPDRSFLMSILPDIKTMDEKQKFKFKLETLKLIDMLKYKGCESSENLEAETDPLLNRQPKKENC
jgi:hypothetical protein